MIKMHKKEARNIVFVLGVVFLLSMIIFYLPNKSLTGRAVFDGNFMDLKNKVISLVDRFPPFSAVGKDASICIQIRENEDIFAFNINNFDGAWKVEGPMDSVYCANDATNSGGEDIIIKYMSYDAFMRHFDSPSCGIIKDSKPGEIIYFLPSEFVASPGTALCNDIFKERYCSAVKKCLNNAELTLYGMKCCRDDIGLFEMPGIFGKLYFWIITLCLFIIIFISTILILKKQAIMEKEADTAEDYVDQLESYISKSFSSGFEKGHIKTRLIEKGWDESLVDSILKKF